MPNPVQIPPLLLDAIRHSRSVSVLSGAGMSAESGVPTFRDAQTGLWARFRPDDLASPEAWDADPALVWAWYLWRAKLVRELEPNAGHRALAEWASRRDLDFSIITQNVDDLHERAGSEVLAHLHGSLFAFRCADCDAPSPLSSIEFPAEAHDRIDPPRCDECGGLIRPGVVWFGESLPLPEFQAAHEVMETVDLVLVVGSSSMVFPAAGLPLMARSFGASVVEINPSDTQLTESAHIVWRETAARALPALLSAISA